MRGRWAQGLEPRFFNWIIKDRLAGSERPGGFARNHRKVRRQEELIWLRQRGFTHVISMLDSPHNLHAYEEAEIPSLHVPLGRPDEIVARLSVIYSTIATFLDDPNERVLVHHEEFGDPIIGVFAGYLVYSGLITEGPHAIQALERQTGRRMSRVGRQIVATTLDEGLARVHAE